MDVSAKAEWSADDPNEFGSRREPATIFCMSPPTHNRYPYSPIAARPSTTGPTASALRSILASISNGFHSAKDWEPNSRPADRNPTCSTTPGATMATASAFSGWRSLFGELKLPVSLLVNAEMYRHAPQAVAAFTDAEMVGHGRTNSERQGELSEYEERPLIEETTAAIEKHSGKRPRGWLGPWISQSPLTPDLLQEAGYRYLLDWCHDDQPVWMKTRHGRILSVPYPQELNDIPQIVARKREGPTLPT